MKGIGKLNTSNSPSRVILQALAGGTVSKITGGKFANGAVTSAIQFVVNELGDKLSKLSDSQKAKLQSEIAEEAHNRGRELSDLWDNDDYVKIKELYPHFSKLKGTMLRSSVHDHISDFRMIETLATTGKIFSNTNNLLETALGTSAKVVTNPSGWIGHLAGDLLGLSAPTYIPIKHQFKYHRIIGVEVDYVPR